MRPWPRCGTGTKSVPSAARRRSRRGSSEGERPSSRGARPEDAERAADVDSLAAGGRGRPRRAAHGARHERGEPRRHVGARVGGHDQHRGASLPSVDSAVMNDQLLSEVLRSRNVWLHDSAVNTPGPRSVHDRSAPPALPALRRLRPHPHDGHRPPRELPQALRRRPRRRRVRGGGRVQARHGPRARTARHVRARRPGVELRAGGRDRCRSRRRRGHQRYRGPLLRAGQRRRLRHRAPAQARLGPRGPRDDGDRRGQARRLPPRRPGRGGPVPAARGRRRGRRAVPGAPAAARRRAAVVPRRGRGHHGPGRPGRAPAQRARRRRGPSGRRAPTS